MKFDPNFVDFGKSDSAIGLVIPLDAVDPIAPSGGHTIKVITPVPFIGVDGGSYVLMPDGKVYPNG